MPAVSRCTGGQSPPLNGRTQLQIATKIGIDQFAHSQWLMLSLVLYALH